MGAQNGRRRHRADGSIETGFDGSGFARTWNDGENFRGLENLTDGHGDRLLRNRVEIFEPAFGDLLGAAGVVEGNNDVGIFGVKIGRGIVEGNVPIFADAEKGDVNRRRSDGFAGALDDSGGILTSVEKVIVDDAGLRNQALLEEFAEAGGVRHGEAYVFVKMEESDELPVDAGICG